MLKRAIAFALVYLFAVAAVTGNWLRPLDERLADWRMGLLSRAPTADIVLVDIDARSISGLGQWPWQRQIHADIVDRLTTLDAVEIAFDIDFSAPSSPDQDAAFEAALKRASQPVILVAFDQRATAENSDAPLHQNRPIDRFAANAWVASVNVMPDADGKIRWLKYASAPSDASIPSLSTLLAGGMSDSDNAFRVDFGIRADQFDRVSVLDLLQGNVTRDRIAGKKVIVGAQATELRDIFNVPVHGFITGSALHALGAESIMQGRALSDTGDLASAFGLLLILGVVFFLIRQRGWRSKLSVLVGTSILIELAALSVQSFFPIEVWTAAWQVALGSMMLLTLLREIDLRRILIIVQRKQKANVQTILDRIIADNFAGVLVVDADGMILAASQAAAALLAKEGDLVGLSVTDVLPPELASAFAGVQPVPGQAPRGRPREVEVTSFGGSRTFEVVVTPSWLSGGVDAKGSDLPDVLVTCLTFVDATERKQAEVRMAYLARFDPMTGLANRNQFEDQAKALLAEATDTRPCAMICIELDRFKSVNDTLGQSFGDKLFGAVAGRLATIAPSGSVVARLGGTDFAILLSGPDTRGHAVAIAEQLARPDAQSYQIEDRQAVITMSVGIANQTPGDTDALSLLKQADTALHQAKQAGGNCYFVYHSAMVTDLERRRQLEIDLWEAFKKDEFDVYYQPQIGLDDGRVIGAEALVRWQRACGDYVSPAEFIPVLESIGLMEAVGRKILEKACAAATRWPDSIKVAVNVSSVQFTRDDLAATVSEILHQTGLPGERLELEITESLFLTANKSVKATLKKVRAMGVSFALDDFGTGYSSLSYVQKFPINKIKIDRSFIVGVPNDPGSVAIVRAVAALAESLGMRMMAEGIARDEQISILRLLGCHEGQGFLFSKAITEEEFRHFLDERKPVQMQLSERRAGRA
ncbi:EAL domain-containing protein [Mesorhizobium sp. 10J20-29]